MDTLQCAIVLAKLERFEWELARRNQVAAAYTALLSGRTGMVARPRDRSSVFAQYTVVLEQRERIQAALHAARIPTAVHYPLPMHLQPAYAHLGAAGDYPVAERMAARVMSLPMGPYLGEADVQYVATTLLKEIGRIDEAAALAAGAMLATEGASGGAAA
jgi:UDP-2-acetamido-2-deoxy-ribo-hexuluronate aminotransferase